MSRQIADEANAKNCQDYYAVREHREASEVKTTTEQYKATQIRTIIAELTTIANYVSNGDSHYIVSHYGRTGMQLLVHRLKDLTEVGE